MEKVRRVINMNTLTADVPKAVDASPQIAETPSVEGTVIKAKTVDDVLSNLKVSTEEVKPLTNTEGVKSAADITSKVKDIVDAYIPKKTVTIPDISELDGAQELYGESISDSAKQAIVTSEAVADVETNNALRYALAVHAENAVELEYRKRVKEEIMRESNVAIPATAPVMPQNVSTSDSNPTQFAQGETTVSSDASIREMNNNTKRNKRLSLLKSTLGDVHEIYLPNSNIKIRKAPNNSLLEKETQLNDAEMCSSSAGLTNMIRYANSASKDISIVCNSKDDKIIKPGKDLKRFIHFSDFKYLIIANALAVGEKSVKLYSTCPKGCSNEYNLPLDKVLNESLTSEQHTRAMEYSSDKSYEDLTAHWKEYAGSSNFSSGLFETKVDEDFGAYNELIFESIYEEPNLEKFLTLKEISFLVLLDRFDKDIPNQLKEGYQVDKMIEYLSDHHVERLTRLVQYLETLLIIKSVKVHYVHNEFNDAGEVTSRVTKSTDAYIPSAMNIADVIDFLDLDDEVFLSGIDYLRNRYGFNDSLIKELKDDIGEDNFKELEQDDIDSYLNSREMDISTLLLNMTEFTVKGLVCDKCGKVHDKGVSSLVMGFITMREALKTRKRKK